MMPMTGFQRSWYTAIRSYRVRFANAPRTIPLWQYNLRKEGRKLFHGRIQPTPHQQPPFTLPAPTAPTLKFSSIIMRKASRWATEEGDSIKKKNQLSLVLSYSDSNASLPEFTVTDSIYIGRVRFAFGNKPRSTYHE
jgi:hypothetical protein